jgi:hypothetical protein
MVVIASVRGWDGSRILGAFESEEEAFRLCRDAGFDVDGDDFYIDVVEINKVSSSQNLVLDTDATTRNFKRIHVYPCPLDTDEKISKT